MPTDQPTPDHHDQIRDALFKLYTAGSSRDAMRVVMDELMQAFCDAYPTVAASAFKDPDEH